MVVSSWMQKESCHSVYVTGFVFNLVLWFQRQTSLGLCLGSVHNCVASAACTDWHHPRKPFKCLESNFPGPPETFLIHCSTHWTDQSLPSVKSPTDSLYLKYLWKWLGVPLGYPAHQLFWGTGAVVLQLARFCLLVRGVLQSCWRGQQTKITLPFWNRDYFASLW